MSKTNPYLNTPVQPPGRPTWLIPAILVGLVVIIVGALALILGNRRAPFEPEVTGMSHAEVNTTSVDLGDVTVNTPVQNAFVIRNVGDQPLMILGEPRVELVEGC
jgi:hypothetical protein